MNVVYAFDKAWSVIKAIGRDDFRYMQAIAPISTHRTNPWTGAKWTQTDPGMQIHGFMNLDNAIRHLEGAEDIESFARRHGFDDETAELGWGPEDWLDMSEDENEIPVQTQREVARGVKLPEGGRRPLSPDEIRENLEPHGRLWGEGFGSINQRALIDLLEERRDAGAWGANVSSATANLRGEGPMVDVNPAFRGLGFGSSTLAAILENTGRVTDSRLSPSGFGLAHSTRRQLDEEGIPVVFNMDRAMKTPIMSEEEQKRRWRESDARFPHQGRFEMTIPTGLRGSGKVLPKSPKKINFAPNTLSRIIEGEKSLTSEEMRDLVESHQRALGIDHDWLKNINWDSFDS